MQEPILFNTTIKQNILFGKPGSSDAKIRQVAEMANALQFIESNFEELTPEEQLDEVRKDIRKLVDDIKAPALKELSKLADLQALTVAKFALENRDKKFEAVLKANPELFNSVVKNELCEKNIKGMKWDDLIIRHEWKYSIVKYLEEHSLTEDKKKVVLTLTETIPCEFDETMIKTDF